MENMNLYKKMYAVMNESEAIEKNMTVGSGKNSYKAVSEAAMLNMIKPLFKKYKLIVFPIEGDIQDNALVWEKTDYEKNVKNDLRAITELKVFYKIVDIETGENEILVGFGNGADPQDKGAGKAFTYSFKSMLSKTFMLFSGEDTDNTHSDDIGKEDKPKADPKAKETDTITEAQAKRIYSIAGKENTAIVKKVMTSHKYYKMGDIKKTDYEKICKEIETAVKGTEGAK